MFAQRGPVHAGRFRPVIATAAASVAVALAGAWRDHPGKALAVIREFLVPERDGAAPVVV